MEEALSVLKDVKLVIDSAFNWLVGEAVDITVKWLNDNLWKKETGKKK